MRWLRLLLKSIFVVVASILLSARLHDDETFAHWKDEMDVNTVPCVAMETLSHVHASGSFHALGACTFDF